MADRSLSSAILTARTALLGHPRGPVGRLIRRLNNCRPRGFKWLSPTQLVDLEGRLPVFNEVDDVALEHRNGLTARERGALHLGRAAQAVLQRPHVD